MPLGVRWEKVAIHVARPTAHGVTGHDVFGHRSFEETFWRVDFCFACRYVGFVNNASDAAVMVNVAMRIDDRFHGLLAARVREVEVNSYFRSLLRNERVNNGDAVLALNNRHVREIEVPNLIDVISDFE